MFIFFAIIGLAITHGRFLLGTRLYHHDNLVVLNHFYLFFQSLLNHRLPLWTSEMNGGEPLWVSLELYPLGDPILWLVWAPGAIFHLSPILLYQWTCVIWLFLFSLGAVKCSRFLTKEKWILQTVFLLLFIGPLAQAIPMQGNGYLIPFRYLPWIFYFLLKYEGNPSFQNILKLGAVLSFSSSGYQSGYLLVLVVFFCALIFIRTPGLISKNSLKYILFVALLYLLINLPMLIAGKEMLNLTPTGRLYFQKGYNFQWDDFWATFFAFDFKLITQHGSQNHGSAFLGWVVPLFAFLGLIQGKVYSRDWIWFVMTAVLAIITFRVPNFLLLRNWGYCLTPLLFCFSQCFIIGVNSFQKSKNKTLDRILFLIVLIGLFIYFKKLTLFHVLHFPTLALGIGLSAFLFLCLKVISKKRSLVIIYFLSFLSLIGCYEEQTIGYERTDVIQQREPHFIQANPVFFEKRRWSFNLENHLPFIYQGASVFREPSAFTEPFIQNGKAQVEGKEITIAFVTHQFRIPQYDTFIKSDLPIEIKRKTLGVDLSVLHSEPTEALTSSVEVYEPNKIKLRVRAVQPGKLVYSDNFYPGWKVFLNGIEASLLRENILNKAVDIPIGIHEVFFCYQPNLYIYAFWLRILFSLGLMIVLLKLQILKKVGEFKVF